MAKAITFHSYKGGAGRSSTAFNTIPYLADALQADQEHPILLLDFDIDSAGMTYLLGQQDYFSAEVNPDAYDVKSFLLNKMIWSTRPIRNLKTHSLLSKFVPVGRLFGVEDGAILFLGVDDAKEIDNKEIDGMTAELVNALNIFADNNEDIIRAIVFDSASGEQTVARMAIDFSQTVVSCMRPTTQFQMGAFRHLEKMKKDGKSKNIVLLPTVVPSDEVEIDGVAQRADAIYRIRNQALVLEEKRNVDSAGRPLLKLNKTFIQRDCFGINEVQRFKWREGLLYKLEKEGKLNSQDEKEAASRYQKLAEVLATI